MDQAHGILDRPTEDVDLFTAWVRRSEFATAVDAVVATYVEHGYSVAVAQRFDTFARLAVTRPWLPPIIHTKWNWPRTGGPCRQ
ncbi:hypothetical protein ACFQX7_15145 [Luedemannella flava]